MVKNFESISADKKDSSNFQLYKENFESLNDTLQEIQKD